MFFRRALGALALTAALFTSAPAFAVGYIYSNVRIEQIQVHNNNGDGDILVEFNRDVCYSAGATKARLYANNSPGFESMRQMLIAVFLSGKTVKVQTNSATCALQYIWVES